MQTVSDTPSIYDFLSSDDGKPDVKERLARLAVHFHEIALPRLDFNALLKEQIETARERRQRAVAPPTLGERILNLIEGPWAPAAQDLPERKSLGALSELQLPFRTPIAGSSDFQARLSRKQMISRTEHRWPISKWSSVYEYDVPVQRLPVELQGFTILHLSDIHFLKGCDRPCVELSKVAEYLESGKRRIDMILLSGDVITRSPDDLNRDALRQLHRMSEVCPQSFMVYGNHDYHGHVPAVISKSLERAGFHDINNHHVALRLGRATLNVFGVDDAYFGDPKAPTSIRPDEINIVLTHNLDAIRGDFPKDVDLILSGHTHWGEVRLFDGSSLMKIWGYCDNINRHTKHWDVLSERTLSFVHPGLARYYVPFKGLRHPPGVAIHTLFSA
jgi:predicted MPP superfamily phosphohydrolase